MLQVIIANKGAPLQILINPRKVGVDKLFQKQHSTMGSRSHPQQHRGGSTTGSVACMVAIIPILLGISGTCSALKDPNLTLASVPGIQGPWNDSLSATLFRNDSVEGYFDIWPENETETGFKFNYFCQDGTTNLTLSNFTYSEFEGKLDPRPYFDLGTVNLYDPYYMNWRFWQVNAKQLSYPIYCEYTDIHGLYVHRCLLTSLSSLLLFL